MQAIDFLLIAPGCLLIVLGGLDFKLHFYYLDTACEGPSVLVYINSVKGHDNAINDLLFARI